MADSDTDANVAASLPALQKQHATLRKSNLALDLTRGKPSTAQLDLSDRLDGILDGDYTLSDGTDARNYGGLRGIPEARELGAHLMDVPADQVIVGGNSSLSLMYFALAAAHHHGLVGDPWHLTAKPKVLCPVPGYDRHFTLCELFGLEMVPVAMTDAGPDMDQVEALVAADPSIKAIFCVPRYSNPTGCVYSDEVVRRMAALPSKAAANFLIVWDNAYAVHALSPPGTPLLAIMPEAQHLGTDDHVMVFSSTSKITFAGAGISFTSSSPATLSSLETLLSALTIGHDKVNQLRHVKLLEGRLAEHMAAHAAVLRPKFEAVERALSSALGDLNVATWTRPEGGYFVSLDTRPGLARRVVALAAEAGVTMTPAGATFPYGNDPLDRNIRIAPTYPTIEELNAAIEIFTQCVLLATAEQLNTPAAEHSRDDHHPQKR